MNPPPQWPAGEYVEPGQYNQEQKQEYLSRLQSVPTRVRSAVEGLNDQALDTKFRNWTIRQIVHHLADSHVNCYIRYKWTLTEDTPVIKAYDESRWSELVDATSLPLESSLRILEGIHSRWVQLVAQLSDDQLDRAFFHPESQSEVTLRNALPSYVWHSDHHLAQIAWVREQHGF